ncbi:phospholipid/glycerol acyltransferase [Cyanobium sp. PCC 7001]|uniref:1-acyl-sn-glycerol-3-phosphate acyltransferase n=1 Tax=Cyanobium sp. PCC 7001 TaxID=180281 RepID=UPI0001804B7D|nr:1-acyl-sn-glycerol-3-phosphate acyltransferase [Cyanobium sp. PCC 7001]EDY37255.1 phospholipid/glycerol acyltransferase [Cyanobium sp. PCC 7001]
MPRLRLAEAQPPLSFIPPARRGWVRWLVRLLLPVLLRSHGVARLQAEGVAELAGWFEAQQQGRVRLFLAFRHPSTRDPLVLAWLFWCAVPSLARRLGRPLRPPVHAQFLYDRGIPLWAGALVGWVLCSLGGVPIQRGKLDRQALRMARELAVDGPFPLAIAPEGATNGHGELISPLEPGLAQLAFWACEDLESARRCERVVIVPIGLRYPLLRPSWPRIERILTLLERRLGLPAPVPVSPGPGPESRTEATREEDRRYARLVALAEVMLSELERFYRQAHGLQFDAAAPFQDRMARLRDQVLELVEARFGLRSQGTLQERCRRIEQAGWERIYRGDLPALSPVGRGLADWTAAEASLCLDHMRLVEPFTAINGRYVAERPTPDRYAELLQILWQSVAWLEGRPDARPPSLGPCRAVLQVGPAIDVTGRHGAYRQDRRAAVEALTAAVADGLQDTLDRGLT